MIFSKTNFDLNKLILEKSINLSKDIIVSLGDHLYVRIYKNSTAVLYARTASPQKLIRLGKYPEEISLLSARYKVDMLYSNSLISKNLYSKGILFENIALAWLDTKKKLARYMNIKKCVEYLSPIFNIPVELIKVNDIKNCLLKQNISVYKLNETLSVFCRIMDYAVALEYIQSHNFYVLKNSDVFPKYKKTDGYKFVEFEDMRDILCSMTALNDKFKLFFLMQIFTCLRSGECRKLKYEYFDLKKKIIKIPAEIMKMKKPFRIPITEQIKSLYLSVKDFNKEKDRTYLFSMVTKDAPLAERDLSVALKLCTNGRVQPHGFRKTARSWFACHSHNVEVSAMCLAHKLNLGADSVYMNSDLLEPRRVLLQKYNNCITNILPASFRAFL